MRASISMTVLSVLLVTCGATACSSSGTADRAPSTAASAAAAQTTTGSDSTSARAAAAGGASGLVDICKVLTAAAAGKIADQPYTKAVETREFGPAGCAYNDEASTTEGVNVNLTNVNADSTWSQVHSGDHKDISGVGDRAFWDNDNTLYVETGKDLVQVNGLESQSASVALAKVVLGALH